MFPMRHIEFSVIREARKCSYIKLVNLRRVCTSRTKPTGMKEHVNEINSPLSNNSGCDTQTNPILFLTQVSVQCSVNVMREHRICTTIPGQLGLWRSFHLGLRQTLHRPREWQNECMCKPALLSASDTKWGTASHIGENMLLTARVRRRE